MSMLTPLFVMKAVSLYQSARDIIFDAAERWIEPTKEIKMSQNVVQRTDKSCDMGRSLDPLPNLRDVVAELSNDEAHRYFRQTRAVVCTLREALIDTNEEIKSMSRAKEALEKSLDHIRKDLFLNNDSKEKRVSRPSREKV